MSLDAIRHSEISYNLIYCNDGNYCGGAIFLASGDDLKITKNTIYGNIAKYGGAIYNHTDSNLMLKNNIIWNNFATYGSSFFLEPGIVIDVSYCDIQGGWEGIGNIDQDPCFVNPESNNFNLKWGSPCIDSGDPNMSNDPDSTIANMGAKYFNQEISPSIELYPPFFPYIDRLGKLPFDVWMYNLSKTTSSVDFWIYLTDPDGKHLGPLNLLNNIELKGSTSTGKNNVQLSLPLNYPFGEYEITGYIGEFPDASDSSSFYFTLERNSIEMTIIKCPNVR